MSDAPSCGDPFATTYGTTVPGRVMQTVCTRLWQSVDDQRVETEELWESGIIKEHPETFTEMQEVISEAWDRNFAAHPTPNEHEA